MIDLVQPQNALLVNAAVTNATTNIVGATLPNPANFLRVGQVWKFCATFQFVHTAAAAPTVIVELAYGATVIATFPAIQPVSMAATYHGLLEAYMTVRTAGAAGSVIAYVDARSPGLVVTNAFSGGAACNIAPTTVDTTVVNAITLRMRMGSAVAANTLTMPQGWCERLVG